MFLLNMLFISVIIANILIGARQEYRAQKTISALRLLNTPSVHVLREGTELLFLGDQEIIRQAFSVSRHPENQVFLQGVMSRKKQMVPALALLWG